MSDTRLAIITPVFNRARELPGLFRSLMNQTNDSFAWYVVDDGSSDETWDVIRKLSNNATFEVYPIHKENGGKHTAINRALREVSEPISFIVDSDDTLPRVSVDVILKSFDRIKGEEGICGISFLKRMNNASQEAEFPETWLKGTYMDVRINGNVTGDKAEAYYTKCLKEFPFPEFPGERFYHEDGVWVRMSMKYEMYHVNEVVYEGTYLEGGLTRNGRALKISSPLGMCDRSAQFLGYPGKVAFKQRAKHALLWDVYSSIAKKRGLSLPCECPTPVLCAALGPAATVVRRKWEGECPNA